MVARAIQQVQIAEAEVVAAKAEVDAAKARVAACKMAVSLADQSVNFSQEAVERSQEGVNSAERSKEYSSSAEKQVAEAREHANHEHEKAQESVSVAQQCLNFCDEASGQLLIADDYQDSTISLSTNAQSEIDRKISLLKEINAPTLGSSGGPRGSMGGEGSNLSGNRKIHYHHIYPQHFRPFFESKGIDIDEWTVAVDEKTHLKYIHSTADWNNVWDAWIQEHQDEDPTAEEILKFGRQTLTSFGVEGLWEGGSNPEPSYNIPESEVIMRPPKD